MISRSLVLSLLALLVGGCSSASTSAPLSTDHPGSPSADAGVMSTPSETLNASDVPPPPNSDAQPSMRAGHPGMGKVSAEAPTAAEDQYTCPMHADVTSDKPGKCPKCGMALVKKTAAGANGGGANHGH